MAKRERPITSAQARKMKTIKATAPPPEPLAAPLHTAFVQVERGQAPPAASVRVARAGLHTRPERYLAHRSGCWAAPAPMCRSCSHRQSAAW